MLARKRQLFFFVSIEDGHDLHRRRLESKVRLNRKIWRIEKHIKKKRVEGKGIANEKPNQKVMSSL